MLAFGICNLVAKRIGTSGLQGPNRFFSIYNRSLPAEIKAGRLTHYSVLGVKEEATVREIKEAYLRLVKLHHPDTSKNPDSPVIFLCIKDAHEVLIDPAKRREYDDTVARLKSPVHLHSFTRPIKSTGTGYNAHCSQEQQDRWERYKRYVKGERNDQDEPYIALKTLMALCVSGCTMFGFCLFAEELTSHFTEAGTEDDDCRVEIAKEHLVKAYHNPVTDRWERVLQPFVAPTPTSLMSHYQQLEDDDFDEQSVSIRMPKKEFVVLEMPFSKTHRPSLLYDPKSRKLVIFNN